MAPELAEEHVVIVGGGIAGYSAAAELRSLGFDGAVTLIDAEGEPYDRPPLSKDYLAGRKISDDLSFMNTAWYEQERIQVIHGTVTGLDAGLKTATLSDGNIVRGTKLIVATGGRARQLAIPGGDSKEIHYLRSKADADRLREALLRAGHVTIIGAGLIGAEVASTARELGAAVTLIDPQDPPLAPAVGLEMARFLHNMHAPRGIEVICDGPSEIEELTNGFRITLSSGRVITTVVLLVGVGILPRTELAESSGLPFEGGFLVDATYQTPAEGVYAVGDSARQVGPGNELLRRSEHWEHAANSGKTAAAHILGHAAPDFGASWFWSDRHSIHLEGVGDMSAPGHTVVQQDGEATKAAFRVCQEGFLTGCVVIDGSKTVRAAKRLIDRRIPVGALDLSSPTLDLRAALRAPAQP